MGLLAGIGTAVAERIHGRRRTSQDFLIAGGYYLFPDQERTLGWCYLGLPAAPLAVACTSYVALKYGHSKPGQNLPSAHFASWAVMPQEVRILIVLFLLLWLIAMVSMFRLLVLNVAIKEQPLSDLD